MYCSTEYEYTVWPAVWTELVHCSMVLCFCVCRNKRKGGLSVLGQQLLYDHLFESGVFYVCQLFYLCIHY